MFDPWSTLTVFTQPCIIRPLPVSLLDGRGLVSRDCLVGLDNLFLEHLWSAEVRLPELPTIPTTIDKWLNTSAMQKAIRRGDVARAVAHAHVGVMFDVDHTFRRLAVCAVEDVGIGNLSGVGVALAACGNRDLKRSADASAAAMRIACLLAGGCKSRLACDLLSIVDYDSRLGGAKVEWSALKPDELSPLCRNEAASVQSRLLAQWLLAGPGRYAGATMPRGIRRPRDLIMAEMVNARLPLMLYYIADRTASRTGDALFVPWLEIGRLLRDERKLEIVPAEFSPGELICGTRQEAFDMHIWAGRRALATLSTRQAAALPSLRGMPNQQRRQALAFGVFIAEGGILDRQVLSPGIDEIRLAARTAELNFCGLPSELHHSFLTEVRSLRSELYALRLEAAEL